MFDSNPLDQELKEHHEPVRLHCRYLPLPLGMRRRRRPSLGSVTVTSVDQTGVVGTELSLPVEARLLDTTGVPLAGKTITFVATDTGSLSQPSATSDADGYVKTRWTLGGFAGSQFVVFRANDDSGTPVNYAHVHGACNPRTAG